MNSAAARTFSWLLALTVPAGALQAANGYLVRNLVSDIPFLADNTDPNLAGAWGIAQSATSPFWISDSGVGLSTLYNSSGGVLSLAVTIPPGARGGSQGTPTGTVYNGTIGFGVGAGQAAVFLFDTWDGTISGWNSSTDATHAIVKVDRSASGAIYTGLAIAATTGGSYLYAANFHAGTIEVFDANFAPVSMPFQDSALPAGFAPWNIQNLGGKLYVSYALQNASGNSAVPAAGSGYVDVFDTSGNLLQRLVSGGVLNAPWGLAMAPSGFGDFANDLLVGNFGDGTINVFHPQTGAYLATLHDIYGSAIVIPNLRGLAAGNGGSGGDAHAVYFTAGIPGPDNGNHGLFGRLQAAPAITAAQVVNGASFQPQIGLNAWVAVQGSNLASTTRTWNAGDFVNGALPTALDGVTVTLSGKRAYIYYVSPTQLNILIPQATPVGTIELQTFNNGLESGTVNIQVASIAPAFFMWGDGKHIAATHADGSLVAPAGSTSGSPAKPGEDIVLYGTGFGQTIPPIPDGSLVTSPFPLTTTPTILFGNAGAPVAFGGLIAAGLYQINITVPLTATDGDNQVVAQVGDQTSPGNAAIPVAR